MQSRAAAASTSLEEEAIACARASSHPRSSGFTLHTLRQLQYQWFNYFLPAIEFVLLFCPFMLMNLALCFSIGPFADAASVAEAMLPVEGGERGGRVVSISTAPPPNADPPKSGSLNELSVELSSVQSI